MKATSFLHPALWLAGAALAQGASILSPSDFIFGFDRDSDSGHPPAESPADAISGSPSQKYLNTGGPHSGLILTPAAPSVAQSLVLSTANDSDARDPASFLLFGTNQPITSTNNSNGFGDHWTLISGGGLSLPTTRLTSAAAVDFTNSLSFTSYWLVFPTLRNEAATSLMQIGEVQLYTGLGGTGDGIFAPGNATLATGWASNTPAGERAGNLLDGDPGTKYLNFGKENAGFEVHPAMGASTIRSFMMTTANDWVGRDPASFELYGLGAGGLWSMIANGGLSLPDERGASAYVAVDNDESFLAYRMVFPTLKDAAGVNSMQLADIQFYSEVIPEPSSLALAGMGLLGLLGIRRRNPKA